MGLYRDRIFPALLARSSSHFDDDRRRLLTHARGRVLELGVGTGANLAFYTRDVTEVVAIDFHAQVLERARAHLRQLEGRDGGLPYRVRLQQADAQALPHADDSFDTVIAFLTLCSVADADAAAREMRRVLRPDGVLLVMEHVRAERGSRLGVWQDRLDPLWSRLAVGCRLNRDTAEILHRAGFDAAQLERYRERGTFPPTAPRIRGTVGG